MLLDGSRELPLRNVPRLEQQVFIPIECNQDLTLRVGLVEPATGAYLGTLVGLAVGAGASALLLAAITVISLIHRWPRRDEEFAIIVLYPLGVLSVLGGALCWLVRDRGRRWFIARTSRHRRLLAIGSGCLTLGVFGIWLFLVLNYT